MIWELGQDRFDEYSLLTTIQDKYTALGFTTTGLCGNIVSIDEITEIDIKIYPNPATSIITVESSNTDGFEVALINIYGQELSVIPQKQFNSFTLNVELLPRGFYLIRTKCKGVFKTHKIVLQ